MEKEKKFHSGFAAITGRPNVGKSTLMNAMIGEKVAIVSSKPQTTRNRIMGVLTGEDWQVVFLDTPGLHTPRTRLGEVMMKSATDAVDGIDLLIVMVDAHAIGREDRRIVVDYAKLPMRKILVLNKTDLLDEKGVLDALASFAGAGYTEIVPVSAATGRGMEELKRTILSGLPEGPRYFPADMLTDQPERDLCAEIIREKALIHLKDEVPHGIGVEMMSFVVKSEHLTEIHATIYCEKAGHKGIIIGKGGSMLKLIGAEARRDIERLLDTKVNLQLWVKVREDWRNRVSDLRTLGYDA